MDVTLFVTYDAQLKSHEWLPANLIFYVEKIYSKSCQFLRA